MREWWPVAFVFTLLFVLTLFVYKASQPEQATPRGAVSTAGAGGVAGATAQAQPPSDPVARFWWEVEQHKPQYVTSPKPCLVNGTQLDVPDKLNRDSDNRLGGVATDLMKIALGPPAGGLGQPDFTSQDWEKLLVTCPACGATYIHLDLISLNWPGRLEALKSGWDLKKLAPPLAGRPQADWTVDERILSRYLTERCAGIEEVELGFTALSGAYASNFAVWYGNEYHIPSAAFYALASAHFAHALDAKEPMPKKAQSVTALALGETYRLLGRKADALKALALAEKTGGLDESASEVLTQLKQLLSEDNFGLQRAQVKQLQTPPTGWYLDQMLPAMNGSIDEHRAEWAGKDKPEAIIEQIIAGLPEQ